MLGVLGVLRLATFPDPDLSSCIHKVRKTSSRLSL